MRKNIYITDNEKISEFNVSFLTEFKNWLFWIIEMNKVSENLKYSFNKTLPMNHLLEESHKYLLDVKSALLKR